MGGNELVTEPRPEIKIAQKPKRRLQHLRHRIQRKDVGDEWCRKPVVWLSPEKLTCLETQSRVVVRHDAHGIDHFDWSGSTIGRPAASVRFGAGPASAAAH